jgi:superfamily II DNA or RNA helicase
MLTIDEPMIDASLGLSWDEVYTEGIVNNTYRNARLVEAAVKHAKRKEPVLFLVQRKWHGRNIAEMFKAKKINHAFVHGDLSAAAIDDAMDDLKAKEIAVLVSTAELLGEGVDIPELDALVLADGGKSPRALLQKIGRALRRKKGRKNVVRVYDCADLTHHWLADHALKRLDIFRAEGFDVVDG